MEDYRKNYDDWVFPFGKWKGKTIPEIPTSYLDWLIGEDWFITRPGNKDWLEAIGKELILRKRSNFKLSTEQDEEWEKKNENKGR